MTDEERLEWIENWATLIQEVEVPPHIAQAVLRATARDTVYVLGELRKRDAAIERVAALADGFAAIPEHRSVAMRIRKALEVPE